MACQENLVPCVEVETAIGFDGSIRGGLLCHPDGRHLVYAFGNAVVVEDLESKAQGILQDVCSESCNYHRIRVSCLDVSRTGRYIAAGTQNESYSLAVIFVWCCETRCLHFKYELHRMKVEALAFTCDDGHLLSLGGPDDRWQVPLMLLIPVECPHII